MILLCNPTGKAFAFRAVDWLVERNNLYTKVSPWPNYFLARFDILQVIFCGAGPNGTLEHIIKESPLIEVYRNCHVTMENAFHLQHRTIRHAPPSVTKMIRKLTTLIKEKHSHVRKDCRGAFQSIPDQIAAGISLAQEEKMDMVSEEDTGSFELEADDFFD